KWRPEQRAAESDSSAAGWKLPAPGRVTTSTPTKPTAIAVQRRQCTHSPNMGPDSAATKNGVEKMSAIASSSCRYLNAAKLQSVEANRSIERTSCSSGRLVRVKPGRVHGLDTMNGNMNAPV